ncbi:hypothetical protein B1J93_17840 [Leptospira kirschneri serovar Pomona]|uniref:Uncharacterized protein n=1 Tax=Leptospira kirschneri serovar Pomona TaxID=561005 RepID=A0A1T1DH79_9LEPT|nr:hypothetical protein [Leptospira kirschneri]OOV40208.1 hypothetical protein B1J93_17840 [Leptospira kirschneri serovar Pomona]
MEMVYLEIIKFLNEGSLSRVLLVLFSFLIFFLLSGAGFLWFKNPEFLNQILRTLTLRNSPEVSKEDESITPVQKSFPFDLIRGLFSNSLDFSFAEKGAILHFPPYMRTREQDELKELLQNIVSSVREVSTENRSIEFDFTNTQLVNPYSASLIFEVIEDVQANNGVYLVLSFRGKHLQEFEINVRKLLSRSDSKSVNVRKRR